MFVIGHGFTPKGIADAIGLIQLLLETTKLEAPIHTANIYPSGIALTLANRRTYFIDPNTSIYTIHGKQYVRLPCPLSVVVEDYRAPRHSFSWQVQTIAAQTATLN